MIDFKKDTNKTLSAGEIRTENQREAVATLLRDRRLIVAWGTGVGKSRVAVGAVDALEKQGRTRVLLLVAETAHKQNWKDEFTGALGRQRGLILYNNLTVECYASLYKYEWTNWDLVIADEAHHLRSENRTAMIATLGARHFLCLTATMSCKGDADALVRTLEDSFGRFTTLEYGLQKAIDTGILREPRIIVHCLSLADFKKTLSITEEWGSAGKREVLQCGYEDRHLYLDKGLNPAATLTIAATPAQAYEYYTRKVESAKKAYARGRAEAGLPAGAEDTEETLWLRNRYNRACLMRKRVLGAAKTTFAAWLTDSLRKKGLKFVAFCADVPQAVTLGGECVIHAGRADNAAVIDAFNRGDLTSLYAVNMIQEGQNLAGIQAGVVIQLGGKEREFVQKFGRAMRSDSPQQHIIVIGGTRDVEYLDNALSGIDPKYIVKRYYGTARELAMPEGSKTAGKTASAPAGLLRVNPA